MVAPVVAAGLLEVGLSLVERIFPDKTKQEEAKLKLLELQQTGELAILQANTQLALKQGDVNVEEAKSDNLFKSGWRPAVGWSCALAFFAKYIGGPALFVLGQYTGHHIELPPIDMVEMMPLLFGLLGLGAYRTYERVHTK